MKNSKNNNIIWVLVFSFSFWFQLMQRIDHLYSKMVKKQRYTVFYGEFENEQKKGKKIDLPERRFGPQIFRNFLAHDLNFHGR